MVSGARPAFLKWSKKNKSGGLALNCVVKVFCYIFSLVTLKNILLLLAVSEKNFEYTF